MDKRKSGFNSEYAITRVHDILCATAGRIPRGALLLHSGFTANWTKNLSKWSDFQLAYCGSSHCLKAHGWQSVWTVKSCLTARFRAIWTVRQMTWRAEDAICR